MGEDSEKGGSVAEQRVTSGSPLILAMVIVLHALNHLVGGALSVLYPEIMEEFDLGYVDLGFLRSRRSQSCQPSSSGRRRPFTKDTL